MRWRDRRQAWDRRALAPDIRMSGGAWPVLVGFTALLLVSALTFVSIGEWIGAVAAAGAAVVIGINAWSARIRWRGRR